MTSNKIKASILAFRFRYCQSFPATARSGYPVRSLPVPLATYVTVYLTLYRVNGLLSDRLHCDGPGVRRFLLVNGFFGSDLCGRNVQVGTEVERRLGWLDVVRR